MPVKLLSDGDCMAARGRVEEVRAYVFSEVFGAPSSITEIVIQIGAVKVNIRTQFEPFVVRVGDDVAVVGYENKGALFAVGWWNCTSGRGFRPKRSWAFAWLALVAVMLAVLPSIVTYANERARMLMTFAGFAAAFAAVVTSWVFRRNDRTRRLFARILGEAL